MNVDQMLAEIPASMLWEWVAYAEVEPFGEERADLRAGIIASTIANVNRRKGSAALKPQDFMPKYGKPKQQDWREILGAVEAMNQAFGGEDNRTEEQKQWRRH